MEEETTSLQDYVDVLLDKWWLLLLGPLLTAIVAVGIALAGPSATPEGPTYEATAVVLMEGAEPLAQFPELVKTRAVLEGATAGQGLPGPIAQLRDQVSAAPVNDTPLLRIKVEDPDPDRAEAIADRVAESLVAHVVAFQRLRDVQAPGQPSTVESRALGTGKALGPEDGPLGDSTPSVLQPYVISPAEASEDPIRSPSDSRVGSPVIRNLVLGVLLGSAMAIIVVFALEYLQRPIRSPGKLEQAYALDRLGVLPRWTKAGDPPHPLAVTAGSDPSVREALRAVASSVALVADAQDARMLAVISPDTGDGRSSLVANLGVALASPWKDIVLVDADLQRPSLHQIFGLGNRVGLVNFVLDPDLQIGDVAQETPYPGLRVITSGPIPPDPGAILASPRLNYLWERLEYMAHLILVDTPPIRAASDGTIIASQAHGVVLLINGNTCCQETVGGMLTKVTKTRTPLLGYIWNRMSPWRFDRYSSSRQYFRDHTVISCVRPQTATGAEAVEAQPYSNGTGAGRSPRFNLKVRN